MFKSGFVISFYNAFFNAKGRMSRSRYWAISIIFWVLFWLLFVLITSQLGSVFTWPLTILFLIGSVFLSIKRLHDSDKSAWWLFTILIPIIGPIFLIIELGFRKGTLGDNRHGDNPLETNYDYLKVE